MTFAPRERDSGIEVVDFRRSERHGFQFFLHVHLNRQLALPFFQRRELLLLILIVRLLFHFGHLLREILLLFREFVHLRVVRFAHTLLVITQNRHLLVRRVVRGFLLKRRIIRFRVFQQTIQSNRGVVSTEHLDRETGHESLKMRVYFLRVDVVEDVHIRTLALNKPLQALVCDLIDLVLLKILDRILTQEIKLDDVIIHKLDVTGAQGTHADGVGKIFILLATSTKGEFIHQVSRHR